MNSATPAARASRAELLLDTTRAAAGVGVRSAGAAPRQLVYRHGAYQLDLMAPASQSAAAARFLWGQLLAPTDRPCPGATVAWFDAAGAEVSRVVTDEFGEFRIAVPTDAEGALRVAARDAAFDCWMPPERNRAGGSR